MITLHPERLSPAFAKWHLDGLPVPCAFHHFTAEEPHADPHDHPMPLTIHVLSGGYVEEVFALGDGWSSTLIERHPGTTHTIAATHIHRIVRLPGGECWTLAIYGPHERETCFWRFGAEVLSRAWHEAEWRVSHGWEFAA